MAVEKYPFDYDALNKGDTIPADKVAEIINLPEYDKRYPLKLMALCKTVERELNDRGKSVTVRSTKGALNILPDADAAEYATDRRRFALGQLRRSHGIAQRVDITALDEDQRASHERSLITGASYLQAIGKVQKALRAGTSERTTPKMIEAK